MMRAVKAYYDGHTFVPLQKYDFKPQQQVLIVVEDDAEEYPEEFVSSLLAAKAEIEEKRAAGTLKTFATPQEMFEDLRR